MLLSRQRMEILVIANIVVLKNNRIMSRPTLVSLTWGYARFLLAIIPTYRQQLNLQKPQPKGSPKTRHT
jgi:hypothetical protein